MKVLHAADFHLDSPLAGLPADKSALRRRELRDIPARLARLAREEGVDLVLLPGDLLDGGRVSAVGSHEELLQQSPIYREVYESQMKGDEANAS